ncbi:fibronectin type III domain-containing protein [Winogradskyella schleiferi]|uniref:hypothetical protein n=1 Tax=Winogradskyella schleiferi TaxID=2686078 RepID=UPI0015BD7E5A|nr:hypothetical protein [Winogradskyella schleiferi]
MKKFSYVFAILFLVFNCSSEENDPDNLDPGPFSVTILETRMDGANIEWTEAIDIDDDPITYSIYLEDQLISTGGTALSYNFTGLEPETSYDGYIIADDGKGGISEAAFFFETEPETVISTINISYWEKNRFPEGNGERVILGCGFEIPVDDDATLYQVEVSQDGFVYEGNTYVAGNIYTWTNDSQTHTGPIEYVASIDKYVIRFASASVNTLNTISYDYYVNEMSSATGEAELIVSF